MKFPAKTALTWGVFFALGAGFYLVYNIFFSFGEKGAEYRLYRDFVMGTEISVFVSGEDGKLVRDLVFRTFREVDQMMSEWKEGSPLAEVNRRAGVSPVRIPAALFEVISRSVELGKITGGAFDISWAALWGGWTFRGKGLKPPDFREIAARLKFVDYKKIVLDRRNMKVFLPRRGMKLGLGGIAKGYALDLCVERLKKRGYSDLLISAGGQVYALGKKWGRRPWRIGIQHPRRERGNSFAVLEVEDLSISTSGDYESYFIYRGKRYHHIIDPRTGYPSKGVSSATVIAEDATLADALSTALMILPPAQGMKLISENFSKVKVVIVDLKGNIFSNIRDGVEFISEFVKGNKIIDF